MLSLTLKQKIIAIIIGIFAGIITPLIGGAGIVITPLLLISGLVANQKQASGTFLASTLSITLFPSTWSFIKSDDVNYEVAILVGLSYCIFSFISSIFITERVSNRILYIAFSIYMLILSLFYLIKFIYARD